MLDDKSLPLAWKNIEEILIKLKELEPKPPVVYKSISTQRDENLENTTMTFEEVTQ